MFRSRTLAVLLLAMFLFLGQAVLVPSDADAVGPLFLVAYGWVSLGTTGQAVVIGVGTGIVGGVIGNYIYDALTDEDKSCDYCSSGGCSSCGSESSEEESGGLKIDLPPPPERPMTL